MNRRLSLSLLLSGLLTLGLGMMTTGVVAQQEDESGGKKAAAKPAQQKGEDESDPKKPPAKPAQPPAKGEDESETKKPTDTPKPTNPPRSSTPDPMTKPAVEPPSEGPFNLEQEAGQAKHPALKKILQEYAKPHDLLSVTIAGRVETMVIEPLPKRFDPSKSATLSFTVLGGGPKTLSVEDIKEVRYYELLALQDARKLIGSGLDAKQDGGAVAVARIDLLRTAEKVLWKARDFCAMSKKEGKRQTDPWITIEQDLNKEILSTRIGEIRAFAESEKEGFDIADALGGALFAKYPGAADLLDALEKLYTGQAHHAVREGNYPHARDMLDILERKYHITKTSEVAAVRKQLMDKSRELYHAGVAKEEKGDSSGALQLYTQAVRIAQENRDAKDRIPALLKKVAILRVGVRKLPEQMSPTTAVTDVDRMATRLIFENLFRLRAGPSAREGYVCDLGADVRITTKGIDVYLPPEIKWSDGEPLTAKDIERSFDILVDPRSPYYDVTAKELLKLQVADPQHFTLTLQRSYLDPAALMCFPIIPADKLPKERHPRNQAFGKNPVGSGPYMFKGYEQTNDGNEAVFVVNPHYRRPDAPEGPAIKEIRFIKYDDFGVAKEALVQGRWQMLLDLTTRETAQLSGINRVAVLTPTEGDTLNPPYLNNPRVYFLAINHRKAPLKSVDVRRAIAGAIDRETILNDVFRGGGKTYHTPIAGPFPLGSWAYNDSYPVPAGKDPLFNATQAKGLAERAGRPSVRLRYPLDDPQIGAACGKINSMLRDAGVQCNIQPSKREDMLIDFGKDQPEFDIAYWYFDFDNETLSLSSLFDPNGLGEQGRNYMGYERDNQLQGSLRELLSHREFGATQRTMQAIHDAVMQKMVLVPLWQLDRHVAVHRSLQFRRLHPLTVFDEVEQWKLFIVEGN